MINYILKNKILYFDFFKKIRISRFICIIQIISLNYISSIFFAPNLWALGTTRLDLNQQINSNSTPEIFSNEEQNLRPFISPSTQTLSDTYDIRVKQMGNQIFLISNNQTKLQEEINNYTRFLKKMKNFHEGSTSYLPLKASTGEYFIDILPLLPASMKYLFENPLIIQGPNCFNAVLFATGIDNYLGYVCTEEWNAFLAKCHKRTTGEIPQPGDFGAIRETKRDGDHDIHGFIYFGNTVFAKDGFGLNYNYKIEPISSLISGPFGYSKNGLISITYYDCSMHFQKQTKISKFNEKLAECIPNSTELDLDRFQKISTSLSNIEKESKDPNRAKSLNIQLDMVKSQGNFQKLKKIIKEVNLRSSPEEVESKLRELFLKVNLFFEKEPEHLAYTITQEMFNLLSSNDLAFEQNNITSWINSLTSPSALNTLIKFTSQNLGLAKSNSNPKDRDYFQKVLSIIKDRTSKLIK